jgi:hypothetical protein
MIKLVTNIHIFRRNPTSRWVDFKTTHQLDGCTQNLHVLIHELGAINFFISNLSVKSRKDGTETPCLVT